MPQEHEESFRVTDRRRRDEKEEPAVPAGRAAPQPLVPAPPPSAPDERSLAGLFMMLATEAVISLGDQPDPVTGQRHQDLPHAMEAIDLLLLLREKTEGNRTSEETQVLDELVYDLQLRYVRATKSSG
jgi:hypothetical protein